MKTSYKVLIVSYAIIIVLVIAIFIHIAVGRYDPYEDYQAPQAADVPSVSYTEYQLPTDICEQLFAVTPEEFFKQPLDFSWTEDFRTYSKLNKKGYLVLRLNEQQKEDWRQRYAVRIGVAKSREIEISSDYTRMTTWSYAETIDSDITAAFLAMDGLIINQLLDGQDPVALQVTFTVMDAGTQCPVYSVLWPMEEARYTFNEYKLSSMTQGNQSEDGSGGQTNY